MKPQSIRVKNLCAPKPYIGVPSYKGVEPLFAASVADVAAKLGNNLVFDFAIGDSAVGRARNEITHRFLKSDCSHLLFIDSDLIFDHEQIARICSHGVDVVGGFYLKKQQGPVQFVCNQLDVKGTPTEQGLIELRYIGTGFLCIARRVFEIMVQKFGAQMAYVSDNTKQQEHDFWTMGVYQYPGGLRRWLSEDWYFCQRWLDCGGKVYGDGQIVLNHIGSAIYPLDYQRDQLFGRASLPSQKAGADGVPPVTPAENLVST